MKGEISMHDFISDNGLTYGLGMYSHSELTWDEESTFKVYNFAAGNELADVNTTALAHPYASSIARPVHVVWTYLQNDYSKYFYSTMTNRFVNYPESGCHV